MSTSGLMKTLAFYQPTLRKSRQDVGVFRKARKHPGLDEQGGVLAQAIGASFWLEG